MNLRSYYFANIFVTLFMIMSLIMPAIAIWTDSVRFTSGSIMNWNLFFILIYLGTTFFELKYYHAKGFSSTFYISLIGGILYTVVLVIPTFGINTQTAQAFTRQSFMFVVLINLFLSFSLIYDRARERRWLKIAGRAILIYAITLLLRLVIFRIFKGYQTQVLITSIISLIDIIAQFIPVFFILNFCNEIRVLQINNPTEKVPSYWKYISFTLFAMMLVVSFSLKTYPPQPEEFIERDKLASQVSPDYEAHTFINDKGEVLPYRLLKPNNYDPDKKYPLMIGLHGGGIRTTDNSTPVQKIWMARLYSEKLNRDNYPAFVFIPNCPPGSSWGGMPFQKHSSAQLVFEVILDLEKNWSIDTKRRYIIGQSMGGYGALNFISTRPDLFAAAVSVNGGGDSKMAKHAIDVPVWIFHGEKDRVVPVEFSRDFAQAIKEAGGSPKYTEYPGEGHKFSKPLINVPAMLDWMFAQRKE